MSKTDRTCVVLIGLAALMLTGCGRQVAQSSPGSDGANTLAVGPDREVLARAVPPDYVVSILDASGGISAWVENKRLHAVGVVKLYKPDNSFYLTEHDFEVYPWSDAIRISASEPRGKFTWKMVAGRYEMIQGSPAADVSPLAGSYAGYADAFLQIVTAPVRLLDSGNQLHLDPVPFRLNGQWYEKIEIKFGPSVIETDGAEGGSKMSQPYWTDGIYYLQRGGALVDMIWLGNASRQEYLTVRGYDYSDADTTGIRVPSKVEIFRAGPDGTIQDRLAQIDIKGR